MLRITGGAWRGRKLVTPEGEDTRPSMDMHRQSLFNILGQDLTGERVLDLFAGSGAFGLESVSRGAAKAVLVENGREALRAIHRNVKTIAPPRGSVEIVAGDCYALPVVGTAFDLVFVAPPYPHFRSDRHRLDQLLASLAAPPAPRVAQRGLVIVQSDRGDFDASGLDAFDVRDVRSWGRTDFTFLRPKATDQGASSR